MYMSFMIKCIFIPFPILLSSSPMSFPFFQIKKLATSLTPHPTPFVEYMYLEQVPHCNAGPLGGLRANLPFVHWKGMPTPLKDEFHQGGPSCPLLEQVHRAAV
jgi:hypothetical protein